MPARNMELPPYKKVYEVIRKHITEHLYMEGDLLPSENELCVTHQVTRPTVRKALDRLAHEGYIRKKQGKGSIVVGQPQGVGILSFAGTTSAVGKENLITKIIVQPEIRNWDLAFSFPLTEREQEMGCIYMERLRILNQVPVFYDITMLPNVNLPRFTSRNFENRSLFDTLRRFYQLEITSGQQKLMAISATEKLREYLEVAPGHPILQLDRKLETNKDGFFIYSQVFCNTEEYSLFGTF